MTLYQFTKTILFMTKGSLIFIELNELYNLVIIEKQKLKCMRKCLNQNISSIVLPTLRLILVYEEV